MILRRRVAATDARSAALDVFATARFLASVGVAAPRLWIVEADAAHDPLRPDVIHAWSEGIGVVAVIGEDARDAAVVTAAAIGATPVERSGTESLGGGTGPSDGPNTFDGRRLAARHALGLDPGDSVQVALGATASPGLAARLGDLDAAVTSGPRRRLIVTGRSDGSARISAELISAIVHPLVLVDLQGADGEFDGLARIAADELVAETSATGRP
jgi:hypothetical protein